MVALTFMGAQIAQKAADGAIESTWEAFKKKFVARFDEPPAPVSTDRVEQLLREDSELSQAIARIILGSTVLRRAQLVAPALRGGSVLWLDDSPENNEWERALLRELGVHVTAVTGTATALDCLEAQRFDLILSDIHRNGDPGSGIDALPRLRAASKDAPIIFYIANLSSERGTPRGAMGITNRPDELLHLTMDALERRRL
jgi:CheY-like chemotaxis protein